MKAIDWCFVSVAALCFVLSFAKLWPLAIWAGIDSRLAFLIPLVIDGCIVVAVLGHLQANAAGQDVSPFRQLNLSCAVLSVVLNLWSAVSLSEARGVQLVASIALAGIPPVLLWRCSEIVLKSALHRGLEPVTEQSGSVHFHKHDHRHIQPGTSVSSGLTPDVEHSGDLAIEQRRAEVAQLIEQGCNVSAIARQLGVSRGTVYTDKEAIGQEVTPS